MSSKDDGTQADRPQVGEMSEEMKKLLIPVSPNTFSDTVIRDLQSKERGTLEKRVRDYAMMLGRCANKIRNTDPEFADKVLAIIDRGDWGGPTR